MNWGNAWGGWGRSWTSFSEISQSSLEELRTLLEFDQGVPGYILLAKNHAGQLQDAAGTVPGGVDLPLGKLLDLSGNNNHFHCPTPSTARPYVRLDANGLAYFSPDGVDDFMQSVNTLDLSSTDKITYFSAIKRVDNTTRIIAEHSSSASLNNGSFNLVSGVDVGGYLNSLARGSATISGNQAAKTLNNTNPLTAVLTITHDIAGDLSTMRMNGVAQISGTGDKGTGNFGNYPHYLWARGGTAYRSNNPTYGLICAGKHYQPEKIARAETLLGQLGGLEL